MWVITNYSQIQVREPCVKFICPLQIKRSQFACNQVKNEKLWNILKRRSSSNKINSRIWRWNETRDNYLQTDRRTDARRHNEVKKSEMHELNELILCNAISFFRWKERKEQKMCLNNLSRKWINKAAIAQHTTPSYYSLRPATTQVRNWNENLQISTFFKCVCVIVAKPLSNHLWLAAGDLWSMTLHLQLYDSHNRFYNIPPPINEIDSMNLIENVSSHNSHMGAYIAIIFSICWILWFDSVKFCRVV